MLCFQCIITWSHCPIARYGILDSLLKLVSIMLFLWTVSVFPLKLRKIHKYSVFSSNFHSILLVSTDLSSLMVVGWLPNGDSNSITSITFINWHSTIRKKNPFSSIKISVDSWTPCYFSQWVLIHYHDYFDIHLSDLDCECPSKPAPMFCWEIPSPRISHFFKEPWFLLMKNGISESRYRLGTRYNHCH